MIISSLLFVNGVCDCESWLGVNGIILLTAGRKSIKRNESILLNENISNKPGRIRPTRCSAIRRMILSSANKTCGDRRCLDERTLFA